MAYEILIVEENSKRDFEQLLNQKLLEGWELHGNLIAFPFEDASQQDGDIKYIQAVKKPVKTTGNTRLGFGNRDES